MKITTYKTDKITLQSHGLFEVLDRALLDVPERCVVAIAAKIVSLCEGRAVLFSDFQKDDLVRQESQYYLPSENSKYGVSFAITNDILIPSAGIDESNGNDHFVLWPKDPQASANLIRKYLIEKHNRENIGVVITDSTTRPLQWGTTGIAIAYSGFKPLKDYSGSKDLFNREIKFQKSNIANGLASAATTIMGEGNEQTPIALLEDLSFVEFKKDNPSEEELASLRIKKEDDLYWPFLKTTPWKKGKL